MALKPSAPAQAAKPAWLSAYEARTDLAPFGDNALALFAFALRFNVEDLVTVAAEAITDGGDDKKCDLVHIDRDEQMAVIVQCYVSQRPRQQAKTKKATDLNTAVTWLLLSEPNELPDRLRFAALELREAIKTGEIQKLHIWYVHNCPESKNVANELKVVEKTASAALAQVSSKADVAVSALEVGATQFEEWYNDTQSPILVNDTFVLGVDAGFSQSGPNWEAYVTSIPIQFLRSSYEKYSTKLFSANVRDYLGSISSDANINNSIKRTAENEPINFWPYNNGVTILVNSISATRTKGGKIKLNVSGMSIVNGAQTTGAVATLDSTPPKEAVVAARFIRTDDQEVLYNIIRYNNSQNKIAAADFRSTDQVQKRLRKDMQKIPGAEYDGGRRGGPTDAIKRRPNLVPAYTVGQALAAMHGDATVAYNQRSDIWANDGLYTRYFNEQTTAPHIIFAYGLLRAVEDRKTYLTTRSRTEPESLTEAEQSQLEFFRRRGSTFLLVTAIAACLEIILGKKVPNRFRLSFGRKNSPAKAKQLWAEIVETYLPLSTHLEEAFTYGLQNQERLKAAVSTFVSLVAVTAKANKQVHSAFAKAVVTT